MAIDRTKPGSFEIKLISDGETTCCDVEFYWKPADKPFAFIALCEGLKVDVPGGELDAIVKVVKMHEALENHDRSKESIIELLEALVNKCDCEDEEDGE